jgi:hypothetical protein
VRCIQLTDENRCSLFGDPRRLNRLAPVVDCRVWQFGISKFQIVLA